MWLCVSVTVNTVIWGATPNKLIVNYEKFARLFGASVPHINGKLDIIFYFNFMQQNDVLAMVTEELIIKMMTRFDQARRESWPNLHHQSDPRRLWSFLERIGAVTRSPTGNDRERRWQWLKCCKQSASRDSLVVSVLDQWPRGRGFESRWLQAVT